MEIEIIIQEINEILYSVKFSYDKPKKYVKIKRFLYPFFCISRITKVVKNNKGIIKFEVYKN